MALMLGLGAWNLKTTFDNARELAAINAVQIVRNESNMRLEKRMEDFAMQLNDVRIELQKLKNK